MKPSFNSKWFYRPLLLSYQSLTAWNTYHDVVVKQHFASVEAVHHGGSTIIWYTVALEDVLRDHDFPTTLTMI